LAVDLEYQSLAIERCSAVLEGQHRVVATGRVGDAHRAIVLCKPYSDLCSVGGGKAADGHAAQESVGRRVVVPER